VAVGVGLLLVAAYAVFRALIPKAPKGEVTRAEVDRARLLYEQIERREAAKGAPPLPADVKETFIKAAVEIGREGDAAEKEALALLAEGKTEQARARLESDIQQAAGLAVEKLRRMGALLALSPGDTGARTELADTLTNLGLIAQTRGDLDAAEEYYKLALELHEQLGRYAHQSRRDCVQARGQGRGAGALGTGAGAL
jgi:tetratricopeptide (TPR) repeat protein